MTDNVHNLGLEELVITLYAAIDDAIQLAEIPCKNGKVIPRRGPAPEIDDREILCLSLLQEILGYESDHAFQLWINRNHVLTELFPRRLTRQKFADRRALLTPVLQRLCLALAALDDDASPFLPSLIHTQSMSVA